MPKRLIVGAKHDDEAGDQVDEITHRNNQNVQFASQHQVPVGRKQNVYEKKMYNRNVQFASQHKA